MQFFYLLLTILPCTLTLNIAIYLNLLGKSHLNFVSSLVDILNERGHNVDLILARLNTAFDYKNVTRARRLIAFEFKGASPWGAAKHLSDPFEEAALFNLRQFYEINTALCRVGLESSETVNFLKEGKYDVMLVSQYEYCGMILARAAGIESVIGYTSTNILPTQSISSGLPNSPNWITSNLDSDKGSLTLLGRLKRLYRWADFLFARAGLADSQTALAREFFGTNFPDVEELERKLDLIYVNSNEIIEMPRALTTKIVYIGGVATSKAERVNREWDNLLNLPSKGIVFISFGTQVPSHLIPRRVKDAIIYTAKQLKHYNFIFKYEIQPTDDIWENNTNLFLVNWVPQKDLLFDSRTSAFVSHMGLNSFLESSRAGVPMISIPLFVDQGHNARCAKKLGTGVVLEKVTFTGVELKEAVEKVLTDGSFKLKATSIAQMLKSQPNSMKQRFIEWTEFAATHKNLHELFNLPEAEATWFSYYCFDLALTILVVFLTGLYISYKVLLLLPKVKINGRTLSQIIVFL